MRDKYSILTPLWNDENFVTRRNYLHHKSRELSSK